MTLQTVNTELTIYSALDQKEYLLGLLATEDELELDLSEVSDIDTAGLQLLVLLKREAAKANKEVHFTLHSPAVQAALELTELSGTFGDPVMMARSGEANS